MKRHPSRDSFLSQMICALFNLLFIDFIYRITPLILFYRRINQKKRILYTGRSQILRMTLSICVLYLHNGIYTYSNTFFFEVQTTIKQQQTFINRLAGPGGKYQLATLSYCYLCLRETTNKSSQTVLLRNLSW